MTEKHIILYLEGAELNDLIEGQLQYTPYFVEFLECNLDEYREIPLRAIKPLDEDTDRLEKHAYITRHYAALAAAWLQGLDRIWRHEKVLIRSGLIQITKDLLPSAVPEMYQRIQRLPFITRFGPDAEARLTITGSQ